MMYIKKFDVLLVVLILVFSMSVILFFTAEITYEVFGIVKPTTIMQYSGFLISALVLNKIKYLFVRLGTDYLDILVVLGFFVAMASFFEVLWAFFYWFTLFIHLNSPNPVLLDAITIPPQSDIVYKNLSLNFAAKFNTFLFFVSVYFVYFIHNIKKLKLGQRGK